MLGFEPRLLASMAWLSPDSRWSSLEAHGSSIHSALCIQDGRVPRTLALRLAPEEEPKQDTPNGSNFARTLACKVSGRTPGERSKLGRRHSSLSLPSPHSLSCAVSGFDLAPSAGFKKASHSCYSDFRNKCSAPLIRTPGVNRAGDILRNAPGT